MTETYECRSIVVLKLSGAQVSHFIFPLGGHITHSHSDSQIILADQTALRGPQLLPYLNGFPCLRELDLSAPARSNLGGSNSTPFILDDKCIISFFQALHTHFR